LFTEDGAMGLAGAALDALLDLLFEILQFFMFAHGKPVTSDT
jgi:hypothetical protein